MTDLRVALLQCASLPGNVPGNLRRLDEACRGAAGSSADLLVTPEMFLTGYNIGRAAALVLAEPAHGARVKAVEAIARRHGVAIVFGHPERDQDGAVVNTAVCVDKKGQVLGSYRKTHLFGTLDREMFSAGSGDEPLLDFYGWKVGLLICYDVEFPENARRLALQGADLIVVPTANMAGFDFVPNHLVRTRAYENQVFVAYANFCGREADLAYNGLSCVISPDGSMLSQGGRGPGLIVAELTSEMLISARYTLEHLATCRQGSS